MSVSARIAGIEIDRHEVRIVVAKTGGRSPAVQELHAAPIHYESDEERFDAQVAAVKEAASRIKTRPTVFVLAAPASQAVVRTLTLPFKGKQRVLAAVPFELEPFLAVPIDDLVVDANIIREVEGQTEVLVVGMRLAYLDELVQVCTAAGVDVDSINVDAAGLTSLWLGAQRRLAGLNALLHLGANGACLAVLHNRNLAYLRPLMISAEQVRENPAAAARTVKNALRAFKAGWTGEEPVAQLVVTGVDVFDEERRLFEEEAGLPVSVANLLSNAKLAMKNGGETAESVAKNGYRWAAPLGVAAACADASPRFEFRKGTLQPTHPYAGLMSHVVFSAALLAVAAVTFGLFSFMTYRANTRETEQIAQKIWDAYAESFPEDAATGRPSNDLGGIQTYAMMEEQMKTRERQRAAFSPEMFSGPSFLDYLREIGRVLPDSKAAINNIRLTSGLRNELYIDGEVKDSAGFNNALTELQQSTLFTFDPGTDLQRTFRDGKETFTIRAIR